MKLWNVLEKFNFRCINEEFVQSDSRFEDTKVIRIYLRFPRPYFDFGVYDYYEDTMWWIEKILNPKLLEKEVSWLSWDDKLQMFEIALEEEEEEEVGLSDEIMKRLP